MGLIGSIAPLDKKTEEYLEDLRGWNRRSMAAALCRRVGQEG